MSYVIAAYGITGLCLVLYGLTLARERKRQKAALSQARESDHSPEADREFR